MRVLAYGVAVVGLLVARCATAAVDPVQHEYCRLYAEHEYQAALVAGDAAPDAAYEGAAEECDVQWLALGVQWDDPANLDRVAALGLAAGIDGSWGAL